jgi:DNA-directed RNA polymerase sigma subunit (sigma70/sigma32)
MKGRKRAKKFTEEELARLLPGEAKVLSLRLGLGGEKHSRAELARRFDVPVSHIERIEKRALAKLQEVRTGGGAGAGVNRSAA